MYWTGAWTRNENEIAGRALSILIRTVLSGWGWDPLEGDDLAACTADVGVDFKRLPQMVDRRGLYYDSDVKDIYSRSAEGLEYSLHHLLLVGLWFRGTSVRTKNLKPSPLRPFVHLVLDVKELWWAYQYWFPNPLLDSRVNSISWRANLWCTTR